MALQKQSVSLNFGQGLDLKTDSKQVPMGKFLALQNTVFDKTNQLTKRNGFADITQLPNTSQTNLLNLNDNLLATGSNLYAFSKDTDQWFNQGKIQPVQLDTITLVRVSTSQSGADIAIAPSGLACLVYTDSAGQSYYQISDSATGQQIVSRQQLASGAINPRAFVLGRYFIVTYMATIGGIPHLQYVAIPYSTPQLPGTAQDISTTVSALNTGYDAFVANNNLYIAWSSSSTNIKVTYLSSTLILSFARNIAGHTADIMSVTADISQSTAVVWVSFWDGTSQNAYTTAYDHTLVSVLAVTQIDTAEVLNTITSVATGMKLTVFYENQNTYSYAPNAKTDYITRKTVTQAGVVSSATIILRGVGLGSKAFFNADGTIYLLASYGETNQPTYFLIDSTGAVYMRLAYGNGGGYAASQVLPSVNTLNNTFYVPYLIKDFLATVNKGTALPNGTPTNSIYTQTGINLAAFSINTTAQYSSIIANTLHLTGGQLWMYDGVKPVEHSFHVWPENIAATTATGSGGLTAQTYYYQFCYEWTDNQGNLHRSAPSIPYPVVTTTSNSTNTIHVPTLRQTYKVGSNPVRIVGYRWSTAQQVYYQFTSITSPVVNDTTVDSVTIVDAATDLSILGQTLLYTTGGVVENTAAPAVSASCLFKNRLFLIDAEDPNLIWYSKQIIQGVPVELSDLLTLYVAPTSGAQGSTGPSLAISAMDDKLIIFKRDAIYYVTGTGPDNTGGNNDFSDPIYITSSVGCANPNSIVLMPNGLMFQSDKGIWLLGRDLSTSYIGAGVEAYNNDTVLSATAIPGTNEVRFILDTGITLMYDYFQQQWGTFSNVRAISATLYQGFHTYLNAFGHVFQETPGMYVDGSSPVLMSFTAAWASVAGLQGYERLYELLFLGTYYTPFKLSVSIAYDYNSSASQQTTISPDNFSPAWGGDAQWGTNQVWGGPSNVFEARLFPAVQKCETFQITMEEIYDPSLGVLAGAGLTLSALNMVIGVKKGYRTSKAAQSFG